MVFFKVLSSYVHAVFHFIKQSWKPSFKISCNTFDEFVFMLSMVSKRRPFSIDSDFGNKKKIAGSQVWGVRGLGDFWHKIGESTRLRRQVLSRHNFDLFLRNAFIMLHAPDPCCYECERHAFLIEGHLHCLKTETFPESFPQFQTNFHVFLLSYQLSQILKHGNEMCTIRKHLVTREVVSKSVLPTPCQ